MQKFNDDQIIKRASEMFYDTYFCRGKWKTYEDWEIQPEGIYALLSEIRSLYAAKFILNTSWFKSAICSLRNRETRARRMAIK